MPRVARIGDPVWCAEHGMTSIITGIPTFVCEGKPIATVGDRTACGATIITGAPNRTANGNPIARRGDRISHGGHILDGCARFRLPGAPQFGANGTVAPKPSPLEAPPENLSKLTACSSQYFGGLSAPPPGNYWGLTVAEYKNLDLPHQKNGSCVVMSAAQVTQLQRIRDGGRPDEPFSLDQANAERLTQCPEPIEYNSEYGTLGTVKNLKTLYANYGYSAETQDQTVPAIRQRLREGKILQTFHYSERLWAPKDSPAGGHAVATLGYVADPADPNKAVAYLIHDTGTGCPAWVPAAIYEASLQEPSDHPQMAWVSGKLPGRDAALNCCLAKDLPFGDIETRKGNPFDGIQAPFLEKQARLNEIKLLLKNMPNGELQNVLNAERGDIIKQQPSLGRAIYTAQSDHFVPLAVPCKAQLPVNP